MGIVFKDVTVINEEKGLFNNIYNINLKFNNKKIYALLGDNNSGINTVLLLLKFRLKNVEGDIKVNKKDSIVLISFEHVFIKKKVKDELEFYLKKFHSNVKSSNDLLDLLNISNIYTKKIKDLTMEERVKLCFVLAFIENPRVIIIDEVISILKYEDKINIIKLLKNIKDKYNKIIIIKTRDTDLMYKYADYFYVFNSGKIVKEGKSEILRDNNLLKNNNIKIPEIINFTNVVKKSNHKLYDYDNVKDLAKGVYRSAK